LWKFNINTNTWTWMQGRNTPNELGKSLGKLELELIEFWG
jgi:hypothetical protein